MREDMDIGAKEGEEKESTPGFPPKVWEGLEKHGWNGSRIV